MSNFFQQDGDVLELCQVSDIRAGGIPKVSVYIQLNLNLSMCTG
jgi:hypothetical protein